MSARARLEALVITLATASCAEELPVEGRSLRAADRLFHTDDRFLGGDGAFSIPLDGARTLWLFGDSFIATSGHDDRRHATMVRNAVGVQAGGDPTTARLTVHVRDEGGVPGPVFASDGEAWFWPAHGVRLAEGPLLVFLARQVSTEDGLGFRAAGYRVARIDDPDADPTSWNVELLVPEATPGDRDATVGVAVIREGPHVYAYASADGDDHVGRLARFAIADLLAGQARPAWLAGGRWVAAGALEGSPDTVIDDIGPECSVHFDRRWARYVHVASVGFGDTDIAMRTAPALEGPWSDAVSVFTPPESDGHDPFVYAAKAHPWLRSEHTDELLVTYATNSFDFDRLLDDESLYFPRFVALRLGAMP